MHHDPTIIAYQERLLEEVRLNYAETDVLTIAQAVDYAIKAHGDQKRISGMPYVTHPLETARKLAAMRLPCDVVVAGVLHDVEEDTHRTLKEIRREFGTTVAQLVAGVTKVGKLRLRGEQRYIENLRKMFVAIAKDVRVVFIKFADRMHNLEDLEVVPKEKRQRIAREALEVYAPIANRLGMMEIKGQLEDLSFPHLYPEEAKWVDSLIAAQYETLRTQCTGLIDDFRELLAQHHIPIVHVSGRMKHRFSLYQKLLRYHRDISQVYDLVALRVVCSEITDCYTVLGLIHERWNPVKGRIKDFVANPKPNGYQSLHTTVMLPDKTIVEFQVRTLAMHEEAEWGAAAAWRYHERGIARASEHQIKWVKELVQWQRNVKDPKDFLAGIKTELLQDRILVFTPKGDIVELPWGGTPIDFAYAIHSEVGNHAVGARVNGSAKRHSLDAPLASGDLVEIIVDPQRAGPSPDWIRTVTTTHARTKIKDALRGNLKTKVSGWVSNAVPGRRHARTVTRLRK